MKWLIETVREFLLGILRIIGVLFLCCLPGIGGMLIVIAATYLQKMFGG